MERIIILGSNSFSGAHLIKKCLKEGMEVVGISRSPEPDRIFLPYRLQAGGSFRFHQLDINHHLAGIMEVIHNFRPDFVVNFAAQGMVVESWEHPEHWFATNTLAMIRLHDQLRHCTFLKKYVHISTPEVYGPCQGLVRENTCYLPSTPYAVSKAATDMSLMAFVNAYNFPAVFTRAANVYGMGQQLYRIIPRTILSFLTGRKLILHGAGTSVRSFIHIDDVCAGTLAVALEAAPGDIFHLATDRNITIRALVEMIAEQMSVNFDEQVSLGPERLGKDAAYLLDCSKAKEILGWQAKIDLENGLAETIAWVRNNLAALREQPLDYIHKP